MTTIQAISITSCFITIILWDFCIFLEQIEIMPKNPAFAFWSLINWIALLTIGIKIFGVAGGIGLVAFGMLAFPTIFRFVFGRIAQRFVTDDFKIPIAFFTIGALVSLILSIVS